MNVPRLARAFGRHACAPSRPAGLPVPLALADDAQCADCATGGVVWLACTRRCHCHAGLRAGGRSSSHASTRPLLHARPTRAHSSSIKSGRSVGGRRPSVAAAAHTARRRQLTWRRRSAASPPAPRGVSAARRPFQAPTLCFKPHIHYNSRLMAQRSAHCCAHTHSVASSLVATAPARGGSSRGAPKAWRFEGQARH